MLRCGLGRKATERDRREGWRSRVGPPKLLAFMVALACLVAAQKKSSAEWRSLPYGILEPLRALWLEPGRAPEWLVAALHLDSALAVPGLSR
jgi:hypothetical protein